MFHKNFSCPKVVFHFPNRFEGPCHCDLREGGRHIRAEFLPEALHFPEVIINGTREGRTEAWLVFSKYSRYSAQSQICDHSGSMYIPLLLLRGVKVEFA